MNQEKDKWQGLMYITQKISQVLQKSQKQFDDRNKTIHMGYISDLRQYCKIVTICEEQLILGLVDYDLQFIGEFIKLLSGYHLMLLNNLLNWIQQYEFYLTPKEKGTPFEQLIEQSLKYKHRFIKIKESGASLQMNQVHNSFQSLLHTNNSSIQDYVDHPPTDESGMDIVQNETEQMKSNLKYNTKKNTQIILSKLLHKSKQITKYIRNKGVHAQVQTDIDQLKFDHMEKQNMELKSLLQTTIQSYEQKLKDQIALYKEAKLIMKAQKYELEHKIALLEAQGHIIKKIQTQPNQPTSKLQNFRSTPTIPDRNKRLSISEKQSLVFSNIKLRSSSLPKIEPSMEQQMRSSFHKINTQLQRYSIQSHQTQELYHRYVSDKEFKQQFVDACNYAQISIPPALNEEYEDEPSFELKMMLFQKLLTIILEKHTFCLPKCDHLNFLQ
ncbi:hypothetical protein pb186bvf_018592 [Paramecium bursaria]